PDQNPCNGVEACATVTVNGKAGQKCMAGTNVPNGTVCGMGNICLNGTCKASVCGDGIVDKAIGEECEPPSSMTCDAMCKRKPICGDGFRETGEQCDDANLVNMDGCDAACKFEQNH